MKNIVTALILFFTIVAYMPQPLFANEGFTRVRGNIYDFTNGGSGIAGLTVTVNCNGSIQNPITDTNGLYVADFPVEQCDKFDKVISSVTYNDEPQTQTVWVSDNNRATLDFYYGSAQVPELGLITGLASLIGSGAAYMGLRKKV